jgi:nitrite reductase/ring-hydroxylating ferredoxin subunit
MKEFKVIFSTCMVLLIFSGASCKKDGDDRVPNVPVDITLNLNNPSFIGLSVVGGWAYITGGSRGIIVYRNAPEEFVALDRHCPYEVENRDKVDVDDSNILAADTVGCGSRFVITDGSITQGPAQFPLTQYQTTYNGTINQLRIFN